MRNLSDFFLRCGCRLDEPRARSSRYRHNQPKRICDRSRQTVQSRRVRWPRVVSNPVSAKLPPRSTALGGVTVTCTTCAGARGRLRYCRGHE